MENEIRVVIGSWGSYNECNERALGSSWITFNDYSDFEEIYDELRKQGFELDGIDEELFIQDIEGIGGFNCDYMHPETLFNICQEAGILEKEYRYKTAIALIEALGWEEFTDKVESKGNRWDDEIYFHENMSIEEALEEMVRECWNIDFDNLGWLGNFVTIDYERMARESDDYYEVSNGCIEVVR